LKDVSDSQCLQAILVKMMKILVKTNPAQMLKKFKFQCFMFRQYSFISIYFNTYTREFRHSLVFHLGRAGTLSGHRQSAAGLAKYFSKTTPSPGLG
jgi:hypothetical protein